MNFNTPDIDTSDTDTSNSDTSSTATANQYFSSDMEKDDLQQESPSHRIIERIRNGIIGERQLFSTSLGQPPMIYADYTASGRSLTFIEDFIRDRVMPYYANTHTETSFTGAQTTALREESRSIIKRALNAGDDYRLIFCGSGATAAINKLVDILNLRLPHDLNKKHCLDDLIPESARPVVLIGPYEHHSNELPWRECIADVIAIPLDDNEQIDLVALGLALEKYSDRPLKIGSFSAASNVTGLKTDVDSVTRLLHQYSALAFWDYAAAAPYIGIDVSGVQNELGDNSMDAIFLSPHKFIGGPGTPGILLVKETCMNNTVPVSPGGGTVDYVTPEDHLYIDDPEQREEGGTPGIIESIRAGLVFKLQQDVGTDVIEEREKRFVDMAIRRWMAHPDIQILGNPDADRLSIVSFLVRKGDKYLHYSYVVALLNDLFGIQARGGCSCAGPYGHWLLHIDSATSRAYVEQIKKGNSILKPGWTRINFNYFLEEQTFEYIVRAVELIAEHGWKLLPYYQFDEETGAWLYQGQAMTLPTRLADASQQAGGFRFSEVASATCLEWYLQIGEQKLTQMPDLCCHTYTPDILPGTEHLRWFLLPDDIDS
jgi:selenocysteine lyase/cysteine desulfurase